MCYSHSQTSGTHSEIILSSELTWLELEIDETLKKFKRASLSKANFTQNHSVSQILINSLKFVIFLEFQTSEN